MNPTLTMCRRTLPVVGAWAREGEAAPSSMTANDTAAAAIFIARVKTSIDASPVDCAVPSGPSGAVTQFSIGLHIGPRSE